MSDKKNWNTVNMELYAHCTDMSCVTYLIFISSIHAHKNYIFLDFTLFSLLSQ